MATTSLWWLLPVLLSAIRHVHAVRLQAPNGTDSWICLPTSGGESTVICTTMHACMQGVLSSSDCSTDADPHGGGINATICGTTCGGTDASLQWLGYVGTVVAVICFGSNFIPVKKVDTGDGMFFQWIMCVGIWLVGLVVNFIQQQPPFYLPALIGGFSWVTGE